jgi:ABC-type Fe3+ transport system substrate-binding protein
MKAWRAALAASLAFTTSAFAADQALIDAAKKEGVATWYTGLIINQMVIPAATAFERKYGVKADYVRVDSVPLRIMGEAQSGVMKVDVFDGVVAPVLKKQGVVETWLPEAATRLPKQYSDPEGQWMATNQFTLTPAFNTNLVPKGQEPKTFEDLLDPKWKGRIAWDISPTVSAGPGFVGLILDTMGEDKGTAYLKKMATQNVVGMRALARQVLDQVIAGEYAIGLQMYNHHVPISAAQGAQVAWIPMQPAMGVLSVISLVKNAPHPNAGKLLMDFLSSPEGQALYRNADYIPVDPAVPPKEPSLRPDGVSFKATYFAPERIVADMPQWTKTFEDVFR